MKLSTGWGGVIDSFFRKTTFILYVAAAAAAVVARVVSKTSDL